jgi:Family of unknown function (DUF6868)
MGLHLSLLKKLGPTMNMEILTTFFGWCTLVSGLLFLISTLLIILIPNWAYRIQSRLFPISREQYNVVIYSFLGMYKLLFILFFLTPYIALRLMQ